MSTSLSVVPAMAVMHEKMHQRTCREQEKWQHAQYMSRVLGQQIKSGDDQKPAQDDPAASAP